MAKYGAALVLVYFAEDDTGQPVIDDESNHVVSWLKDGSLATATNAPAQVDATLAPGAYKITMTATEMECASGVLLPSSSTSMVFMRPVAVYPDPIQVDDSITSDSFAVGTSNPNGDLLERLRAFLDTQFPVLGGGREFPANGEGEAIQKGLGGAVLWRQDVERNATYERIGPAVLEP